MSWDLERNDGRGETWVDWVPAPDFAASLRGERARARIAQDGDGFVLSVKGLEDTRHASVGHAMIAGDEIMAARDARIEAEAFEAAGLSRDLWRFSYGAFYQIAEPDRSIRPHQDGSWDASIGSLERMRTSSAREAEAALAASPCLPHAILARIEKAYVDGSLRIHPDHWTDLVDLGYVVVDERWDATLTERGAAVYDADPRVVPTALQDIVYAKVVELDRRRRLRDDGEDRENEYDDLASARYSFGRHLGATSEGNNAFQLMNALRRGYDLDQSVADTEPHEVTVVANGEDVRDVSVLLLMPRWVCDDSELLAQAVVACQEDLKQALEPGSSSPAP